MEIKQFFIGLGISMVSASAVALTLTSNDFSNHQSMPSIYTCIGKNISPALTWSNVPVGTQSFILQMTDRDAPSGTWTHWVIVNLPGTTRALSAAEVSLPGSAMILANSWGQRRYNGPCPPSGTHHYVFELFALDTMLSVNKTTSASNLPVLMQGHILTQAKLMSTFSSS